MTANEAKVELCLALGAELEPNTADRLLNQAQVLFVRYFLKRKGNDDIREIQQLKQCDIPLSKSGTGKQSEIFDLPEDVLQFIDASATATKGSCTDTIQLLEWKSENVQSYMFDECNCPSFKHREAGFTYGDNKVKVYTKDDFEIKELCITYYRHPKKIQCEGYFTKDENGEQIASTNCHPEWNDNQMYRIIQLAAFLQNGKEGYLQNAQLQQITALQP